MNSGYPELFEEINDLRRTLNVYASKIKDSDRIKISKKLSALEQKHNEWFRQSYSLSEMVDSIQKEIGDIPEIKEERERNPGLLMKRSVEDRIRALNPSISPLLSLLKD
jgi:predicted  nucleic acid-binding Zn-ribbon protein